MEYDRYQHNKPLFISCMVSLLVSLGLFTFSLYILPNLIWNLHYDMPAFVFIWCEYFKQEYGLSEASARTIVFFIFFLPAVITAAFSCLFSNTIENEIYGLDVPQKEVRQTRELKETMMITLQLLAAITIVIVAVLFVYWLLAIPAPVSKQLAFNVYSIFHQVNQV